MRAHAAASRAVKPMGLAIRLDLAMQDVSFGLLETIGLTSRSFLRSRRGAVFALRQGLNHLLVC
jgi:hypothetical protein